MKNYVMKLINYITDKKLDFCTFYYFEVWITCVYDNLCLFFICAIFIACSNDFSC